MVLLKAGAALSLLVAIAVFPTRDTKPRDIDFCVPVVAAGGNNNRISGELEFTCTPGRNELEITGLVPAERQDFPPLAAGTTMSLKVTPDHSFSLELKSANASARTLALVGTTCDQVLTATSTPVDADGHLAEALFCVGDSTPQDDEPESAARLKLSNAVRDAVSLTEEDAMYHILREKCVDYSYDVSLYVDTHMMAVAVPQQDGIADGCPLVVVHSKYNKESDVYEKDALVWANNQQQVSLIFNDDSYSIGTFRGLDLIQAYETIDLSIDTKGKSYDIVTNNCAMFMIALAKHMNIKIDTKMTTFVARRLLENANRDFVNRIRNSASFLSLFSHHDARGPQRTGEKTRSIGSAPDKELIDLLVASNSADLL